jgi:hypothetical protein
MVRRGFRGWEVEYLDGTIINEDQAQWKDIPKQNLIRLTLRYDGREWNLNNKDVYFQKKRAYRDVMGGVMGPQVIYSRSIGYYEGNSKILYTVDEATGRMQMEVKKIK